ncbi:MAG: hypothetical protein KatS3mg111_0927 [Pirellulaceae bacterium]|nr:MAG: hypothetical protein KatS3mg111_0927 [Pirellulaceae bacterium]
MNTATKDDARQRWWARLQKVPGAGFLFAVIPLTVLGYWGWYSYGAVHLDRALYSLKLENLAVTPQPEWVGGDVAQEVFTQARLDRLSLLDPTAAASIAQAFEAHQWVKSAARVTKEAGGKVRVDLVYRRPLAMVYYAPATDPSGATTPAGFFPVDDEAIVLPTRDFDGRKVFDFFLIFADGARPSGDIGMPFGDPRIVDAVELCRYLEADRQRLGLKEIWIEPSPRRATGARPWTLIVVTDTERRIIWGEPPSSDLAIEPTPSQKREMMIAHLQGDATSAATIDLRSLASSKPVAAPSK